MIWKNTVFSVEVSYILVILTIIYSFLETKNLKNVAK